MADQKSLFGKPRPNVREKIENYGAQGVPLPELIEYVINPAGNRQEKVSDVLVNLTPQELFNYMAGQDPDLTDREARLLEVLGELIRQVIQHHGEPRERVSSPEVVARMMSWLRYKEQEEFHCLLLNTKNEVVWDALVSIGTVDSSVCHPRDIFKTAIKRNAVGVVFCHNHPSGDPAPSPEDLQVTRQLVEAGKLIGIPVVDHIVLGDGRWVSLREKGYIA